MTLPAGTVLPVRLEHGLSTRSNRSGDAFTGRLDSPLMSEGVVLAPAGSRVSGMVSQAVDAGRIKGRAYMTLVVHSLEVNGTKYALTSAPRSFQGRGTRKRDVITIAGATAVGATIGAIAGAGKGALLGAGIGGGSGTGLVLATRGRPVAFPAETRIRFTLADELQLPVQET